MRRRSLPVVIFLVGLLIAALFLGVSWYRYLQRPLGYSGFVYVHDGESLKQISKRLVNSQVIDSSLYFTFLARLEGVSHQLKVGEYQVLPSMTPVQLLALMVAGHVFPRDFTLVEGWTFSEVKAALLNNPHLKHDLVGLSDKALLRQLGSSYSSPEGVFLPETYRYHWGDSDLSILRRAYQAMQSLLVTAWPLRAKDLPYKRPYDALIMASLIEKETALEAERFRIAGVLVKRLQVKMRLQVDPTVSYGLRLAPGTPLTKRHLRTLTPYNTYRVNGLPPTPIDNPGAASVEAALHPAIGKDLYYVSRGDGSHQFSEDYASHLKAVNKWQR